MDSKYPVIVTWSEADAAFVAACPQLEGCMAHGETQGEAAANVESLIQEWLVSAKEHSWDIPIPMTAENNAEILRQRNKKSQERFQTEVKAAVEKILQTAILPQIAQMMAEQRKEESLLPQLNEWESSMSESSAWLGQRA